MIPQIIFRWKDGWMEELKGKWHSCQTENEFDTVKKKENILEFFNWSKSWAKNREKTS